MPLRSAISIIIPVRNEREHVGPLLDRVLQQAPADAEVVVIDGMSDDGTRNIVADFARRDQRVCLVDNPNRIVTTAVNLGLQRATGEAILRLDAHAEYAPDYVAKCLEVLEETGAGNVGGAARPVSDGSLVGDIIKAIHESPFGIGAASFRRADVEGWVDTVWPGAFRREALEQAGMYCREDLPRSEDIELNSRIRAAGWGIYQSPKIVAHYRPRRSIQGLLKQNFGNGQGVVHTLKAGLGGVSVRHMVPAVFVACLLAGAIGGLWWPWARYVTLGVLALYTVAVVAFALRMLGRYRAVVVTALPVIFLALHLSYGLGSLVGAFTRPRAAATTSAAPLSP